jgi:hypothetical protein
VTQGDPSPILAVRFIQPWLDRKLVEAYVDDSPRQLRIGQKCPTRGMMVNASTKPLLQEIDAVAASRMLGNLNHRARQYE